MRPGQSETSSQDIKLTDDLKDRLLSHFKTRFQAMKDYRDILDAKVVEWIKLYNARSDAKQFPWMSNIFVPYVFSLIQQLVPRIRDTLFGTDKFIAIEAHDEKMYHAENKMAGWFTSKLRSQRFQQKARDVILQAFKYPIGILKARWVEKKSWSRDNALVMGVKLPFKIWTFKTKGECQTEIIPFWDFYWDPQGIDEDSCKDMIHRALRDVSYVRTMIKEKKYDPIGDIPVDSFTDRSSEVRQEVDIYQAGTDEKRKGYGQVEIMEYWGSFDVNGDGVDEPIILTVINQSVIAKLQVNKMLDGKKPFKVIKPIKEDNQFTGMPSIKMLESLQNELNTVRNQRIDNRNLQLKKVFKAKKYADIESETVFSGPGNVMWVNDMDDIQEFRVADVSTTATIEEQNIKNDMQVIMGTTDYRGLPDSATGVSIVQSEVASRYQDMLLNLKEQFEEYFQMQLVMYRQFCKDDEIFREVDPETGEVFFDRITPEELDSEYAISINIKAQAETTSKQGMLVNLLNILGKYPDINTKVLVRNILEAFEIRDIDEIMRQPQQAMPMPGAQQVIPEPLNPTGGLSTAPQSPVRTTPQIEEVKAAMEQATAQTPGVQS